jgi:hypothetical protein
MAKVVLASFRQNAPRPHAEEPRSAGKSALRSVPKHEGPYRPHPSRRAHVRLSLRNPTRTRAPQDEAAQAYRARGSSPNRFR